jgi:predicted Fe-Mo cluster-binding NifX family protein
MKVLVTATGTDLDAATSPVFGRCPTYMVVDTETMDASAIDNPAVAAGGGAGIQAAQFVVEQGVQAVVSGNLGPNAYDVLHAAQIPVYTFGGGTVREAVDAFQAGSLSAVSGATVASHTGMGRRRA